MPVRDRGARVGLSVSTCPAVPRGCLSASCGGDGGVLGDACVVGRPVGCRLSRLLLPDAKIRNIVEICKFEGLFRRFLTSLLCFAKKRAFVFTFKEIGFCG